MYQIQSNMERLSYLRELDELQNGERGYQSRRPAPGEAGIVADQMGLHSIPVTRGMSPEAERLDRDYYKKELADRKALLAAAERLGL